MPSNHLRPRHPERAVYEKRTPQNAAGVNAGPLGVAAPPLPGLPHPVKVQPTVTTTVATSISRVVAPSIISTTVPSPLVVHPVTSSTTTPVVKPTSVTSSPKATHTTTTHAVASATVAPVEKTGGLSSGGVAGVVIALLLVIIGVGLFLFRARSKRMREKKRATWGAIITPSEKPNAAVGSPPEYPYDAQSLVAPPPMSYNNNGGISPGPDTGSPPGTPANVRCAFIPTLPDELSITMGDVLRILSEYDDGWALCVNPRGEQGVVPLECLEKCTSASQQAQSGADWRNAQRASSLFTHTPNRY